jgi:superfamily II DNA/RNA helicase
MKGIGEEGLDIGEVDLIVNFDTLRSPIRMLQRVGRTGRKRDGRVICLVAEGPEEKTLRDSQQSERNLAHALKNPLSFKVNPSEQLFLSKPVRTDRNMSKITAFNMSQVEGHSKRKRKSKAHTSTSGQWRLSEQHEVHRKSLFGDVPSFDSMSYHDLRRRFLSARLLSKSSQHEDITRGRGSSLLHNLRIPQSNSRSTKDRRVVSRSSRTERTMYDTMFPLIRREFDTVGSANDTQPLVNTIDAGRNSRNKVNAVEAPQRADVVDKYLVSVSHDIVSENHKDELKGKCSSLSDFKRCNNSHLIACRLSRANVV